MIVDNAKLILKNNDFHRLVDKGFSEDHPYSAYTAAIFETR